MKQVIYLLAFAFMNVPGSAQPVDSGKKENEVINLQALQQESSLYIHWESSTQQENDYWEVQGSIDGKEFTAIGFVMGMDPRGKADSFRYKQDLKKIKPGMKYFRVLHIQDANAYYASAIVKLKID